ncbi:MAG: hypothetical protein LBP59_05470 [Planctomycetaceae bacterium]|nr:hypothetical protein [Planctomycetaceae bacterium]
MFSYRTAGFYVFKLFGLEFVFTNVCLFFGRQALTFLIAKFQVRAVNIVEFQV